MSDPDKMLKEGTTLEGYAPGAVQHASLHREYKDLTHHSPDSRQPPTTHHHLQPQTNIQSTLTHYCDINTCEHFFISSYSVCCEHGVRAQTTHERNAGTCYSCKDGSFLSGETPSHIWTNKLELQCAKYPSRAAGINLAWFNINSICYKRLLSLLKSVKLDAATVFSLHLLSPSALPTARQCFCHINMQKLL